MAQTARPILDVTRTDWTEDDGTTVSLFDQINESTLDEGNFIHTGAAPTAAVYVCKISQLVDPVSDLNHIPTIVYSKNAPGGDAVDLTVELRQGYVSEGNQGTLIATWSLTDVGDAWVTEDTALSGAEADSVTDYTNLFFRLVGSTQA